MLVRYARGPGFESRSGHVLFSSPSIYGDSVCVRAHTVSSKGTVSSVSAWFPADSNSLMRWTADWQMKFNVAKGDSVSP